MELSVHISTEIHQSDRSIVSNWHDYRMGFPTHGDTEWRLIGLERRISNLLDIHHAGPLHSNFDKFWYSQYVFGVTVFWLARWRDCEWPASRFSHSSGRTTRGCIPNPRSRSFVTKVDVGPLACSDIFKTLQAEAVHFNGSIKIASKFKSPGHWTIPP